MAEAVTATERAGTTSQQGIVRAALARLDRRYALSGAFFALSSLVWLVVASVLLLITSIKLHLPGFLADEAWLSYGRLEPAAYAALLFGWIGNATFALAPWMMSRLSRSDLNGHFVLIVPGIVWNKALSVGILMILCGQLTGYSWFSLPQPVFGVMVATFLAISLWGIITFACRRYDRSFVSQWYLLGSFFWTPWVLVIALIMLFSAPATGTVQSLVDAWCSQNLFLLWVCPVALAIIYYVQVQVLGRAVRYYHLAAFGFWSFAFFASWTGANQLIGSPVPSWTITASTAASMVLIVPALMIAFQQFNTFSGRMAEVWSSPSLRFIFFAVLGFAGYLTLIFFTSFRSVGEMTRLTYFESGLHYQGLYGCFSMAAFGGLYYMLPRLFRREWPSSTLIQWHFWLALFGSTLLIHASLWGGMLQGQGWLDGANSYADVQQMVSPFLILRSIGLGLLLFAHLAFLRNFLSLLCSALCCKACSSTQPTLLGSEEGKAG